ncbi:MAG: LuxR C-terminal-related transcriptional regulator [Candidatus Dormibacteria bacterium]
MAVRVERKRGMDGPAGLEMAPPAPGKVKVSRGAGLPSGTVTLILGDVEGSSRRWEAAPSGMAVATARCHQLISEVIERFGAVYQSDQREGDSFVAGCPRAVDALECALALQREFRRETWPEGADLTLRIGLHTGDVELRDERNYMGTVINRAARLRDIAHGEQVILSQSTYEMVVDHLGPEMSLLDLGICQLRDLARPEHVYQLCHPELRMDFPRLRSVEVLSHNLPSAVSSFIGREKERATVLRGLADNRGVTLTGSGGCGKSRLALEVAHGLVSEFPEGVWWVALGGLTDRAQLEATLAATLAVRDSPLRSMADSIVAHLAGKKLLIVLDNCEHMVEACAALSDLILRSCPSIRLISTSREPLGVLGEMVYRVPSLGMPEAGDTPDEAAAQSFEAIRLFADRARSSRPNFKISEQNVGAVIEICRRLDGIPLAIELAAARVRTLPLQRIVTGLSDRFRLLTGGTRMAVPRQQTLEASIEWSVSLLTSTQHLLLQRLAIFPASFTMDAAEATCADDHLPVGEILDLLTQLVDRSLVQVDDGNQRYVLLETIRHYALRELTQTDDHDATRARHMGYYVQLLSGAKTELRKGRLKEVRREYDNIRAAIECALQTTNTQAALTICDALFAYWASLNRAEGMAYMIAALALPGGSPRLRALVAAGASITQTLSLRLPGARELANQALLAAEQADDPWARAMTMSARGLVEAFLDPPVSRECLVESLQLRRSLNNPGNVVEGLVHLGISELLNARLAEARKCFREGLDLARTVGSPLTLPMLSAFLAMVSAVEGDTREALALGEETLALTAVTGDRGFMMMGDTAIGIALLFNGNLDSARTALTRSLEIEHGEIWLLEKAMTELGLGLLEVTSGDGAQAGEYLRKGRGALDATPWRGVVDAGLALSALVDGDDAAAEEIVREALAREHASSSPAGLATCLAVAAVLARRRGDLDEAESLARDAVVRAADWGSYVLLDYAMTILGTALGEAGAHAEATRLFSAAAALRRRGDTNPPGTESAAAEYLDLARAQLGPEAFASELAAGAAMTVDQVISISAKGRGGRKRPALGWSSLTPMERQVATLIAEGLTNPQIGERLYVSPRTVQTHIKHIFGKLGMATRSHIAAEVTRRTPREVPAK